MNSRNLAKLRRNIAAAGGAAVAKNGYVTAIDVLLATGWLRPEKVEDWRRGRVPYLEQVVVASLPKISTVMRVFRSWAQSAGLRPSENCLRQLDHGPSAAAVLQVGKPGHRAGV